MLFAGGECRGGPLELEAWGLRGELWHSRCPGNVHVEAEGKDSGPGAPCSRPGESGPLYCRCPGTLIRRHRAGPGAGSEADHAQG